MKNDILIVKMLTRSAFAFLILTGLATQAVAFESFGGDWDSALSRVTFDGEAQLGVDLYGRPSNREGDTAFVLRELTGTSHIPVDENNEFVLKLRSAEERSTTTKKFIILLDEAHLSYFSGTDTYFLGLVQHPWLDRQTEFFSSNLWGPASRLASTRFKYIALSDQGFVWRRDFSNGGQVQLAVLNGEENRQEETGPKKEFVAIWDHPLGWGWISLGLVYGGYEQYAPVSEKSRILFRTQTRWGRSYLGIELLMARDPADAVTDLAIADGVQLSAELPGQRATAAGGTIWWLYQLNDLRRFLLKIDALNPSQEVADKALNGTQLAVVSEWSESVEWTVYFEHLQKQARHSTSSLQSDRLGLSAQITF